AFAEALSVAAHGGTQILGKGVTRPLAEQPADGQTVKWTADDNKDRATAPPIGHDATSFFDPHSTVQSGPGTTPMTPADFQPRPSIADPFSALAATEPVSPLWHAP